MMALRAVVYPVWKVSVLGCKNYFLYTLQMYHPYDLHSVVNNNHVLDIIVRIMILNVLHGVSRHLKNPVQWALNMGHTTV